MKGEVVHQWIAQSPVHLARIDSNGNLLYTTILPSEAVQADKISYGLRKLDSKSNLEWHLSRFVEHDFEMIGNGRYLIEYNAHNKDSKSGADIYDPHIEILDKDKKTYWKWRSEKHIEEIEKLLGEQIQRSSDWAHL